MNFERSEEIDQLATALAVAQGVLHGAVKDSINPAFGAARKYADLSSCWDACRKPLSDNGLAVMQAVSATGPAVTVTTILTHKSGQFVSSSLTMTSEKSTPQGIGGAITYGRRYALCAMVGIAPEDDDGNEASGIDPKRGSKDRQQEVAQRKVTEMQPMAAAVSESRAEAEKSMVPPKKKDTPTTTNFSFLEMCAACKKVIGEPFYYRILQQAGFEKSNQVLLEGEQKAVIKALSVAKRMVDAAGHGEILPKVTEGIFELFPEAARAAVFVEMRNKLAAVCGGMDNATDEFESARAGCFGGTQWDFYKALSQKIEYYSKQGVA